MPLFKRRKKEEESPKDQEKTQKSGASMKDLYKSDQDKAKPKKKAETQKAKTQTEDKEAPVKSGKQFGIAYRVLVKPIITEKSGDLGVNNKYIFEVADSANKIEVSKSIEEVYGVRPVKVNIINMKGKRVRFGRTFGKRKDWKKAVVSLPQGKTINVYEGV